MSLHNSATGNVVAASMPAKLIEQMIGAELQADIPDDAAPLRPSWKRSEQVLSDLRAHGMAQSVGNPIPGINALAAPVFNLDDSIELDPHKVFTR